MAPRWIWAARREMSLGKKNARRPWAPEDDKQLGEMAAAGKSVTLISLRLKRSQMAVRGRMSILKISARRVKP
jgi:hypothetical protein